MKKKKTQTKYGSVGGQALMEGIMMNGPEGKAMALRLPDGSISVEKKTFTSIKDKNKFFGIPMVRGIVNFVEALIFGYKCLMESAEKTGMDVEEEENMSKLDRWISDHFGEKMMKVIGEEGTSAEDYILYQKGELLDAVYLQQNSFDPIDAACSPDRQREEFGILYDALMASYDLEDKNEIRGFFNQLRQEFLDWHGTEFESQEFYAQEKKISEFYKSKAVE